MNDPQSRIPEEDMVLLIKNPHRAGSLGRLLSTIGSVVWKARLTNDSAIRFIERSEITPSGGSMSNGKSSTTLDSPASALSENSIGMSNCLLIKEMA